MFADRTSEVPRVDLDVGEPLSADDATPTNAARSPTEMELSELEPVTMSEVGTKLDLARAYMDMGDPDGARSILDEVLPEGNPNQKQEAQRLIDSLPSGSTGARSSRASAVRTSPCLASPSASSTTAAPSAGWQSQAHARGVQSVVEAALSAVADHPVEVTAAGRTDAGVHAADAGRALRHAGRRAPSARWVLGATTNLPHAGERAVGARGAGSLPRAL